MKHLPEHSPQRSPQPRHSNSGQGLTEYLILLVLISLVSIAAVRSLGGTIQRKLSMVRSHIEGVSASDKSRDRDG